MEAEGEGERTNRGQVNLGGAVLQAEVWGESMDSNILLFLGLKGPTHATVFLLQLRYGSVHRSKKRSHVWGILAGLNHNIT